MPLAVDVHELRVRYDSASCVAGLCMDGQRIRSGADGLVVGFVFVKNK
jgi:hypothetical protein